MARNPFVADPEWLALAAEEPIDPGQRIVDAHHHLWPPGGLLPYSLPDLQDDVGSHRVEHTVFAECHSSYRADGPPEFAPVGETEFVAAAAAESNGLIAGIVGRADLRLPNLDDVLDAHVEAANGLFRGIRDAIARADAEWGLMVPGWAPEGLAEDAAFIAGVKRLGARGFTYDSWHYHPQNGEFLALARAVPDTVMVLDHFGMPLGVGPFENRRDEIFEVWKREMAEIATCENVVAKLGGLAMIDCGFGWHVADRPPTSDEFAAAQGPYYSHMIETFGPDRCMFESNFPMDRVSVPYGVMANGVKKIMRELSASERDAFFAGTATRVYSLD